MTMRDYRVTIREIAKEVDIIPFSAQPIVTKDLTMRRVDITFRIEATDGRAKGTSC